MENILKKIDGGKFPKSRESEAYKGERHTDVQTVLEKNIQPIHNIIKTKYTEQRKGIEATKEKVILYIKKCL